MNDNKVFEFVQDVRERSGIWNFEFESAQDIIEILKSQWSFLFKQALMSHERVNKVDNTLASRLSNKALKYLLDKGESFEMLVFLQMMQDEIGKYEYLKRDCVHSVVIKPGPYISETNAYLEWQQEKLRQLQKMVASLNCLFDAFHHYYGQPGVPADIDGLYYVARRYGELYRSMLEWVTDVRSTNTKELFAEVNQILSNVPMNVIEQLEDYPAKAISTVEDALNGVKTGTVQRGATVQLSLQVSISDEVMKQFQQAMTKLQGKLIR